MQNKLTNANTPPTRGGALVLIEAMPLDQNAAAVYLAKLAPGSRSAMQGALNTLARLLGAPSVCNDNGKEITCLLS